MTYEIKSYTFLEGLATLTSNDFHTENNAMNTDVEVFNVRTSYIQGALKFLSTPSAIFFYYNNTDNNFLIKWARTSSINSNGSYTNNVNYYHVNLDYETELKSTLENINERNPFFWIRIPQGNTDPFVLFYLDTYPQFTYNGTFNEYLIADYFDEYQSKVDNSDLFRNKLIRKEVKENKTGYYISLVENDFSSIQGVSLFLKDYLGTTQIQIQNYGTSSGNFYEFNKTKVGDKYKLDLISINNKNDIITLTNLKEEDMGYFREVDLRKEDFKDEIPKKKKQNNDFVINQAFVDRGIIRDLEVYLEN